MTERDRDAPMTDVLALQQAACDRAGSRLYATILGAMIADVEAGGPVLELLDPWSENALADAVPLRFLAAIHGIVLDGRAPELARFFPSAGGTDDGDPVPAFFAAVADHRDEIVDRMHLGVQTNEVGRSASLMGGFHEVARRTGLPLRLLEVGASAGLLLRWDHYRYQAGASAWGEDHGVCFVDPWDGPAPTFVEELTVAERRGCDIAPIDATTDAGVAKLRGFLWPDQLERRARLDAAVDVARRFPATVDESDAGAWVSEQLARPVPGVATVVYHSIVLQYLPRESFATMRDAIHRAGSEASDDAPVFWLRMEPAGEWADIRLRAWPGGDDHLLGTTGYHGPPVHWNPPHATS